MATVPTASVSAKGNAEPVAAQRAPQTGQALHAGFVSRAAALILDIAFVTAGSIIFTALISLIFNFFGISTEIYITDEPTRNVIAILQLVMVVLAVLAVLFFIPGYFVVFWVLVGATPGKQILGLQVIRTKPGKLGWVRATIRFFAYFISAIFLFCGFLWVLVDRRRQGWHDKFAGTFVVYDWDIHSAPGRKRQSSRE